MTRLAIIGTAGRREDCANLTVRHWERMVQGVQKFIKHRQLDLTSFEVVSGGAAWADHLAVALVVEGIITPSQLTLYLPTKLEDCRYAGDSESDQKVADTANYYHKKFSEIICVNSLSQLDYAISSGTKSEIIKGGFKARNAKVAKSLAESDELLAFTFGNSQSSQPDWAVYRFMPVTTSTKAGLKDGGTADTWNRSHCFKNHARIGVHP